MTDIYTSFKKLAFDDVSYFLPYANKELEIPAHLKPIPDVINSIIKGNIERVSFSVPPQHGKSLMLLYGICLYLMKNPTKYVAYIGYAQQFAQSQTRKSIVLFNKFGIVSAVNTQREYINIAGGGLLTSSIGGVLTGYPIDWLIIDDPISGPAQAHSKVYREALWDWFNEVANPRIRPTTSLTVVHTRWHLDDLIGRLIKTNYKMQHIRIPALYDGLDVVGKPVEHTQELDAPLWNKFGYDFYNDIRRSNPYTFYALYQGLPISKGNTVFKDVCYYSKLPENYRVQIGTDFAYTESSKADYSVIVIMYYSDGKYYVVDVIRYQKEIDYTYKIITDVYAKYKTRIAIESNGTQKSVADTIEKMVDRGKIKRCNPTLDKFARSQAFSSSWNLGDVLLPDPSIYPNNWLNEYIEEVSNFTGVKDLHDDQVDASVNAFENSEQSVGAWKIDK